MELETPRLTLIPLEPGALRLWTEDTAAFEAALALKYEAEEMTGGFLEIVKGQLDKASAAGKNAVYETFWLLVLKAPVPHVLRLAVGSACFKGPPDEYGQVEIGYGLGDAHRGKGYMAEAVAAMCSWALAQPGVQAVVAETEPGNAASENVLRRCGFVPWPRPEVENSWWRLAAPK